MNAANKKKVRKDTKSKKVIDPWAQPRRCVDSSVCMSRSPAVRNKLGKFNTLGDIYGQLRLILFIVLQELYLDKFLLCSAAWCGQAAHRHSSVALRLLNLSWNINSLITL